MTNNFIEALKKKGKKYIYTWYNFRGTKRDIEEMGTKEKPLIYYLYGSVDEPESLVLSEDDLLDFLIAIISKNPPLPANISSEFRNKTKCFLFIGFGFNNWYLRILLLHVLQDKSYRDNRSFALEQIGPVDDPNFQYAIIFFKDHYKIHYYNMELKKFVRELNKRYHKSTLDELKAVEAPIIFICHCNEDKNFAIKLYKKFQRAGLKPWLDVENLKPGDEWNRITEKTIKEIDYFIVLQSKTMEAKKIGYVNKEIHLALQRQLEFRGLCFIIPAKIEDCALLDELSKWQTIDLSQQSGFDKLIQTIKRDQERRNKLQPCLEHRKTAHVHWRLNRSPALYIALPGRCFDSMSLPRFKR